MIVVDASVVVSWVFEDEQDEIAKRAAARVLKESALAPSIFPAEVANALLSAHRKGRIPERGMYDALEHIAQLPIRIDSGGFALRTDVELAKRYDLTVYDAMYLGLARRHRLPLLTRDAQLRRAALAEKLAAG